MPAKPLEYLKKNEDGNYNYLFFFLSIWKGHLKESETRALWEKTCSRKDLFTQIPWATTHDVKSVYVWPAYGLILT